MPRALTGERLDRVDAMLWDLPRREVSALVSSGRVRVDGAAASSRSRRMAEGEVVEVDEPPVTPAPPVEPDADVPVPVVALDEHVVVVDKPPGLVVHPGPGHERGTLVHGVVARWPEVAAVGDPDRPGIVHRLDAGTSGLLVVARTPLAYTSLVDQLRSRRVERRYFALVWGHVDPPAGVVDAPVGRSERDRTQMAVTAAGKEARTRYELVERYETPATLSLLECTLETGRTHQIRVHLAAIGHPVAGDVRYGGRRPALPVGRPFLHARFLAFDDPATGERRAHTSPLPADLEEARELLR